METVFWFGSGLVLLVGILFLVEVIQIRLLNKSITEAAKGMMMEQYPELSEIEIKFQQKVQVAYLQTYSKKSYLRTLYGGALAIVAMLFLAAGMGCLISDNFLGCIIFISLFYFAYGWTLFYLFNRKENSAFWREYLKKHPENELMVPIGSKETSAKLVKLGKKGKMATVLSMSVGLLIAALIGLVFYLEHLGIYLF